MTADRNRRFWKRVLIAYLLACALGIAAMVYCLIQIGKSFENLD